jgi:hypothetical protein
MNWCAWDCQDDYRYPAIPCPEPATMKVRGIWYCHEHGLEAEDHYRCQEDAAYRRAQAKKYERMLEDMEEL